LRRKSCQGEGMPRAQLSKERVLGAAVALADREGIEALSMRNLGQEVGVEAMSLYNHVRNKEELLNGMVDIVFSEIDLQTAGEDRRGGGKHHARDAGGRIPVPDRDGRRARDETGLRLRRRIRIWPDPYPRRPPQSSGLSWHTCTTSWHGGTPYPRPLLSLWR